jgi:ATP-dependent RNA helicase DeaD
MPKHATHPEVDRFDQLGLNKTLLNAIEEVGYESPSPIQCKTIPLMLEGKDILGQAPTGTGKTAAFALPLLSDLKTDTKLPQIMVLTPTRELTIQVAEAFQKYGSHIEGFRVLPIYGGQTYTGQISQLRRGVQVVVGTPGRIMDHMRKGTLELTDLKALVLDEADEMLRMGFVDDVEWILEKTPEERQMALFSATMPKEIERIAHKHLREPAEVSIKSKTATAASIRQRYWIVSHHQKLDALTRILEIEHYEAMIIFARTKACTIELANKIEARGLAAAAINGDMPQKQREQTIERLKRGALDILIATDVAARGLDVERITHVVNYDIPYDTEAYIHRIGRTGRAGLEGDAILFVTPREKRMLSAIERATRQPIELMQLPSIGMVNDKRIAKFKQQINDTLAAGETEFYKQLIEQFQQEHGVSASDIAAALARMTVGKETLLLDEPDSKNKGNTRGDKENSNFAKQPSRKRVSKAAATPPEGYERYRIQVGHDHDVKPANIVGAIANEAGLDAAHIGHIDIYDTHSTVDLPGGMPRDVFRALKKVWVCKRQMNITHEDGEQKNRNYQRAQRKTEKKAKLKSKMASTKTKRKRKVKK